MDNLTVINKEGIFISYRREGGSTLAGLLYHELCKHFAAASVFKDVNSLKPGSDFKLEIEQAIISSSVLLVLIDKNWINITTENGDRKILSETDFVSYEIKKAVETGVEIIPLLFENGRMPGKNKLPEDIASLCDKNAFTISPENVMSDIETLIAYLKSKRKYSFEEKTISGSYERLFKDPVTTFKKSISETVDVLKKDYNYFKGFLNRNKKK